MLIQATLQWTDLHGSFYSGWSIIQAMDILDELKQERDRIDAAIRALDGTRGKSSNGRRRGRRSGRPPATANAGAGGHGMVRRRRLSAAARKKISDAAKARWAKAKKAGRTSLSK